MKSRAVLADVRDGHREPAADLAIHADRVLIRVRQAELGIELQLLHGIDRSNDAV